jgi:phospholipid transport system substrate-binding protein
MAFIFKPVSSFAEDSPILSIKKTVNGVLEVLRDPALKDEGKREIRRKKLRSLVYARFDFEEMSRRALGRYWRKFTPAESDEFIHLFSKMLEKSYVDKIESYTDERVEYLSEKVDMNYSIVKTKIVKRNGLEIPIQYKLILKNGDWRVYDVLIEGVSLVNNYRSQFRRIMRKNPPEHLLQKMREKTKKKMS